MAKTLSHDHRLCKIVLNIYWVWASSRGITEKELNGKVDVLKQSMPKHEVLMAVGTVWCADSKNGIDRLLSEADRLMYEDKAAYYASLC